MLSEMSKDNLELLSYTKIAELYLREKNKTMNTADLFREICKLLDLSEEDYQEKIGDFFESLTTSKEFILLNDGNWDLKENHSVKIDMDDIYDDSDSSLEEDNDGDLEESNEDNYEDDSYEEEIQDDVDDINDDYDDLTIVDENELDEEN